MDIKNSNGLVGKYNNRDVYVTTRKEYDNMNKKKKIIGNIIFIVEIIITILFLILIYEYIPVG